MSQDRPLCLSIAGFDPSGGAGIIADLRAFDAFNVRSAAVVSSITFQNQKEFFGATHQSAKTVGRQLDAVLRGGRVSAIKTGMLPTAAIVEEIASRLIGLDIPAVVDPVIFSTTGGELISAAAIEAIKRWLFPLATLVTPNIPEAETLTGLNITSEADAENAARVLFDLGARAVLVKGGHASGGMTRGRDLFFTNKGVETFDGEMIHAEMRGTGCMLASAIAANLALGLELAAAISAAKRFITKQLRGKARDH